MAEDLHRWAPRQAREFEQLGRDLDQLPTEEAASLAGWLRRTAPRRTGALLRSISARSNEVVALNYADIQDEGGTIRAVRRGWLTIPVRPGYVPGPGYVTVRGRDGNQYVLRSGSFELWAVRRRSVRIRGSRWKSRALAQHLREAEERVAEQLVEAGT